MKALSIWQSRASLIMSGYKKIETRFWRLPTRSGGSGLPSPQPGQSAPSNAGPLLRELSACTMFPQVPGISEISRWAAPSAPCSSKTAARSTRSSCTTLMSGRRRSAGMGRTGSLGSLRIPNPWTSPWWFGAGRGSGIDLEHDNYAGGCWQEEKQMGNDVMCSSGAVTILAIFLQTLGVLALMIGFFSGLGDPEAREGWSSGVFLAGVVALAVGTRISTLC